MRRHIALLCGLTLALHAVAQDGSTAKPPATEQEQRLQKAVDEMIVSVEKHSGLAFARRPKVRAVKAREWREIVKREFHLEKERDVFEASVAMLGMYLAASDEVVLSPLVVGPLVQVVADDAPRHVREAVAHQKATIAHELVHALQEQHFALPSRLAKVDDKDAEEILRIKALIEGHAVVVEELIAEQELGLEDFMQRGPYGLGTETSYVTGRRYFLHLLRSGGMKAVREALAKPPTWAALLELANKELPPEPPRVPAEAGEPKAGGGSKR
ncbi:MAG TPA: hypothetical protein VF384_13860 [Planctomycetota bacterium]